MFGTLVSKVMTANIFVDRYLFFAHGLIWLFSAIVLADILKERKRLLFITCIFIVYIGAVGFVDMWKIEYFRFQYPKVYILLQCLLF